MPPISRRTRALGASGAQAMGVPPVRVEPAQSFSDWFPTSRRWLKDAALLDESWVFEGRVPGNRTCEINPEPFDNAHRFDERR